MRRPSRMRRRLRILGAEHPRHAGIDEQTSHLRTGLRARRRMRRRCRRRRWKSGSGSSERNIPDTLASNNLASTYCAQGRTTEAVALEEEAREKRKRILGVEHKLAEGLVLLDLFFQSTAADIEIGIRSIATRPPRNDVLRRSLTGPLRLAPPHPLWAP
jgi:Tetratricopeptide repeat